MVQTGRARILAVDDEADILGSLVTTLEGALPVEVIGASSGADGLKLLQTEAVDLIISDYRMAYMTGLEFLRKAAVIRPDAPRVMLTAFPDMELAISAINDASVTKFLTKPILPQPLIDTVADLVARSRKESQHSEAFKRSVDAMGRRKAH